MHPQRTFGIEAFRSRRRREFEQHAAEHRLVNLRAQRVHLRDIDQTLNRQLFLFDLFPNCLGKHDRRQARRLILENFCRSSSGFTVGGFFLRLDRLPLRDNLIRRIQFSITENMRMSADQFFVHLAGNVLEVKLPCFLCQLRVKDHLDQHIAQFLTHVRQIHTVDRID